MHQDKFGSVAACIAKTTKFLFETDLMVRISNSPGLEESLQAYPKHVLISIGTNGFTKEVANRDVFMSQVSKVVDTLEPIGIIVYVPAADDIFVAPRFMGIPVCQFDSFMQKRNSSRKRKKGDDGDEK